MHSSLADLHAYADEELDATRRRHCEAHLAQCATCRRELQRVQQQRQCVSLGLKSLSAPPEHIPNKRAHLAAFHAKRTGNHSTTSPEESSSWAWLASLWQNNGPLWAAPAMAACFLALVWLGQPTPGTLQSNQPNNVIPPPPSLQAKGDFHLELKALYAPPGKMPGRQTPARSMEAGSILHPGGLIQFRLSLSDPRHAMVLSVNQKGEIFAYAPFRGKASVPLAAGQTMKPLASSLELDDVLGPERFILLTSKRPFTFGEAHKALIRWWQPHKDARRPLHLQKRWQWHSLLLYKHTLPQRLQQQPMRPRRP